MENAGVVMTSPVYWQTQVRPTDLMLYTLGQKGVFKDAALIFTAGKAIGDYHKETSGANLEKCCC